MKKVSIIFFLLATFGSIAFAQTVTIGTQVWMTKNLDVSNFRNGDPILEVRSEEEWIKALKSKEAAWCYYDNNPANGIKHGKLYNWYAIIDSRGLAPDGWHIPDHTDFDQLITFLGGGDSAFVKLAGTNLNNGYSFSAYGGGGRNYDGKFSNINTLGGWWCKTFVADDEENLLAWGLFISFPEKLALLYYDQKGNGFSVRCLRD